MPSKTQIAAFGDVQIAYRDEGDAKAPALVLAHSMGFDLTQWDAVLPLLPPGLRVIRFDLRGHGQSSVPPAPYSMGMMIHDAERLLDKLQVRDAVFCGLSMGGMLAQGLAVKRLDLVRGLVLSNTATKIGTKQLWAQRIDTTRKTGLAARLDQDMTDTFSPAFRAGPKAAPWRTLLARFAPEAFFGCCTAIAGADFYTTTASLRLPCLVIASAADRITPPDMVRELSGLIPGAQFRLIARCGHLPPIEQPEAFASVVSEFLLAIGHVRPMSQIEQ